MCIRDRYSADDSTDTEQAPNEYLDRQPVLLSAPENESMFDSAFVSGSTTVSSNGAHVNGKQTNGKAMNGAHVNGTAVKGVR